MTVKIVLHVENEKLTDEAKASLAYTIEKLILDIYKNIQISKLDSKHVLVECEEAY